MFVLDVYRGITCEMEEKALKEQKITGNWYSTDLSDAINFAMKTKGTVIRCKLILKKAYQDCFLTSLDEKSIHKGWGLQAKKADFSFGDWYYIHPNYLHNVHLEEFYSYEQALIIEDELDRIQESTTN